MPVKSISDVRADIAALVDNDPEATRSCVYVTADGSGPNCIIGHLLHGYGVPIETLVQRNSIRIRTLSVWVGIREHVAFTEEALNYLAVMQAGQDLGDTWAEAHIDAEIAHRTNNYGGWGA